MATIVLILAAVVVVSFAASFAILSAIRLGKESDRIANELHVERNREDHP